MVLHERLTKILHTILRRRRRNQICHKCTYIRGWWRVNISWTDLCMEPSLTRSVFRFIFLLKHPNGFLYYILYIKLIIVARSEDSKPTDEPNLLKRAIGAPLRWKKNSDIFGRWNAMEINLCWTVTTKGPKLPLSASGVYYKKGITARYDINSTDNLVIGTKTILSTVQIW